MNRFSFHNLAVILAAVFAVLVMAFFVGCDSGDDGTPITPPDVVGTYYAIADFGGGEQSIMLVLQMPSTNPTNDGYYVLTGFVSYGDSSWGVAGTAKDDTVNFTWTPPNGVCNFSGTSGDEQIQGTATGPGWTASFTAYRETGAGRDIAGQWEGGFQGGSCYPPGGALTASFFQTDSAVSGTLFVVSNEPEMGDTLVITEGFFHEPIFEVTAIDSGTFPPSRLILLGTLGADDSLAGAFDWWWARCFDEGFWHLERGTPEPPDTPDTSVFEGILAGIYVCTGEGPWTAMSMAYVDWRIDGVGVSGATITADGVTLEEFFDGAYITPESFDAFPGEEFTFNISHPEYGNTSGTARVPGDFTVTSPLPDATVPVGEDLAVTFTEASGATFYTATLQENDAFISVPAPATSITLPGSGIQTPGDDVLGVEAIQGDYSRWQENQTGYFGLLCKSVSVTVQ